MILGSILLLFLQANVELTLPDYLSRIVNIGIQQGGVDTAVPEAMRVDTYQRLQLFLTTQEEELVAGAYLLLQPSDNEYSQLTSNYQNLDGEPIYRVTYYTSDENDQDEFVQHNNVEAIRTANGTVSNKIPAAATTKIQETFDLNNESDETDEDLIVDQVEDTFEL